MPGCEMKQCPNYGCIIYTRLDELPDTYLRCPQCDSLLVEGPVSTGFLQATTQPFALLRGRPFAAPRAGSERAEEAGSSEANTSPYVPMNQLQPDGHYVQQPLIYEDPYAAYTE